jgi:methylmalonyl-CoA mutase cobalamin-binding domain/chain
MNSRERVLAVLNGQIPDRVPWIENYVSNEVMAGLMGHENFVHATYSQKIERPGMIRVPPEMHKLVPIDNISYDLAPPRFAKTQRIDGHDHITEGLIKDKEDLRLLDSLPDPDDESLYKPAEEYLKRYKGELAAIATVRTGPGNTYLSMGIDRFCTKIVTEPDLVKEVLWRFSNWSRQVAKNMQELPFDLFFMPDDIGFGHAPMISAQHFREFCVPVMRNVIDVMKLPAIYHSDGNIMPLMEEIIGLGVAGIANMEPGPMDIDEVKRLYGDKVTIVGNIDLHYTLTKGTPEETAAEVKKRIDSLAPGGRYILASANSLPNYVKPANVRAMGDTLLKYGFYKDEDRNRAMPPVGRPAVKPLKVEPDKEQAKASEPQSLTQKADPLQSIKDAVIQLKQGEIARLVSNALSANLDPLVIINDGLIRAMDEVGKNFAANKIFVPEMMVSAMTMKTGLDLLKPLLKAGGSFSRGRVMIATVKGDLHDIGKNIVAMMLEGAGFDVIDLGINVEGSAIINKLRENEPNILGLSALLTTTMPEMDRVLKLLSAEGLRGTVKVIVGGAPLSAKFAEEIGADGYGADAATAVDLCKRLVA